MRPEKIIILLFMGLAVSLHSAETIGTSDFKARIATPEELVSSDKKYQPRFDLLGAVRQIWFDGKPFLTQEGLCDEFGILATPPGYADAEPGGRFMKYGIGILVRDIEKKYLFYHPYPVYCTFKTGMVKSGNSFTFEQSSDNFQGYSYHYQKTITIFPATKTLKISYKLTNTGSKDIRTSQYNHNYFSFAPELDDLNYRIKTKFKPKPMRMTGNSFDYKDHVYYNLRNTKRGCYTVSLETISKANNEFELYHTQSPYHVTVTGDFPSKRFAVSFNENQHISPEIFINISLPPGESLAWSRCYQFRKNQ